MLPADQQLLDPPLSSTFLAPRNITREKLEDWSRGGAGINDSTQGLNTRNWRFHLENNAVRCGVPGETADVTIYTLPEGAYELAGSFDTNMQPVLGWMTPDWEAWFRWFDPTIPGFTAIQLAAGSHSVRVVLDDARFSQQQTGVTDTIITYMRDSNLYYRMLRDRFEVERLLKTGLETRRIGQFGMNRINRLQWEILWSNPDEPGAE